MAEPLFQPTRFVFQKSIVATAKASSNLIFKQDSLIDEIYHPNGKDSLTVKKLKELQMEELFTRSPQTEIIVEVQNDSIWRHTRQDGTMIGDFLLLQKNSGVLNYYDKTKSVNYRKFDLLALQDSYDVIEDRNNTKLIKGFICHKLILIRKNSQSDLGDTMYSMYVTNQIDLPIHSVTNLSKLIPHTFPLEISVSEENLPGLVEHYILTEME